MKKYLRFTYIPRKTFTSLVEGRKTTDEIAKLCTSYQGDKDVSVITSAVVSRCNEVINHVIMNEMLPGICGVTSNRAATILEDSYANDFVDEYLKGGNSCETQENQKCCEIIPISTSEELTLLIVVEKGFLRLVAESKEALCEHFLTLLRHAHDHDAYNGALVRKYLGLKMNKGYLDLVKLRLDRR